MKNLFAALALVALTAGTAFASSPALILDAGSNPKYFGSTVNEVSTETGPVAGDASRFRG